MDVKSVYVSLFTTGGGRNLIGWRTESDRAADGIRSGGERNLIRRRTESDRVADVGGYGIPAIPTQSTNYQTVAMQQEGCVGMAGGYGIPAIPTQSTNYQTVAMQQEGCVGMAGGYGIPAIPTQSTNYQTVRMQQEGCVGMARMPYPPNTEKAQSSALWALLLFGRCRIRGSGSSLSTLLLEERCLDQRSHRASCRGARKT